jgi:peptidoglycan/xylan/chitin deacetylase (PgdA/CDA1 family)
MKRSAIALLSGSGLLMAARALQRSGSVILTYHGVLSDGGDQYDFLNHNFVSDELFESQLRYICRHYRPIALRELVTCYEKGSLPPPRSIAVTFDDGFANNRTVAYPLLKRHGVPFTIFLTTGLIDRPGAQLWTERLKRSIYLCPEDFVVLHLLGREIRCSLSSAGEREEAALHLSLLLKRLPIAQRDAALEAVEAVCGRPALTSDERGRYEFLTWNQIREMASAGVEFGSHTVQHPILSTLDSETLTSEIAESKRHIETSLKLACQAFAYPNGSSDDYGEREKSALRAAGYRCAVSLRGNINGRRPDLFELDRINIGRRLDDSAFQAEVAGLLGRARAVRRRFARTPHAAAAAPHEAVGT